MNTFTFFFNFHSLTGVDLIKNFWLKFTHTVMSAGTIYIYIYIYVCVCVCVCVCKHCCIPLIRYSLLAYNFTSKKFYEIDQWTQCFNEIETETEMFVEDIS